MSLTDWDSMVDDDPPNDQNGKPAKPKQERKVKPKGMFQIAWEENQTEVEAAARFAAEHTDKLRYSHAWKAWLVWTGNRWEVDAQGIPVRRAKKTAAKLMSEAVESGNQEAKKYAMRISSAKGIAAMLTLAQSDMTIDYRDLDSDPWLFNCKNGTIDLRTGTLRPHSRADLITKICPTAFMPGAQSDEWDRFLKSLFDRQDDIDFLRRFFGYCLTGLTTEQLLAIFFGCGSNGKSVFIEAILSAIGLDYSMTAAAELLMESRNDRHPTEKADLFGKRLVVASETEAGRQFAEATVKTLTGGDRIRARWCNKDFFEFPPTHSLVLLTNHKPIVRGTDHAIWRRLRLIPFTKQFWDADKGETGPPELKADKALTTKLKACTEAILAWAVQGCLEWQRDGLGSSLAIQDATAGYKAESDVIGRFVSEFCLVNAAVSVRASQFQEALTKFCEESGDRKPAGKQVTEWIERQGFERKKNNGIWYVGIALLADEQ